MNWKNKAKEHDKGKATLVLGPSNKENHVMLRKVDQMLIDWLEVKWLHKGKFMKEHMLKIQELTNDLKTIR